MFNSEICDGYIQDHIEKILKIFQFKNSKKAYTSSFMIDRTEDNKFKYP